MKVWTNDSASCSQSCFDCTHCDVFHDSCDSLFEVTNTITSYVSFCVDTVVPVKCCKGYIQTINRGSLKQLKEVLNKKKIVYFQGGVGKRKDVQREVKNVVFLSQGRVQGQNRGYIEEW